MGQSGHSTYIQLSSPVKEEKWGASNFYIRFVARLTKYTVVSMQWWD